MAHPSKMFSNTDLYKFIKSGLRAIEVWHPSHSPYQARKHESYAKQYQLLKTGGSDYHARMEYEERNFAHYGLDENQFNILLSAQ